MAKKLDPLLIEILTSHGENVEQSVWDCHGTWVVYHKAIERIAAKAGVVFDMPQIIEANTAGKTVAIAVRGVMGERSEWSFGEASPGNCKNAYPYAMAEKRAKDRVVLKLVGLSGLAYSEEESDDFKPQPKRVVGVNPETGERTAYSLRREGAEWDQLRQELAECDTILSFNKLCMEWALKVERDKWPETWKDAAREEMKRRKEQIINGVVPDDDSFPGDRPSNFSHPIMAG